MEQVYLDGQDSENWEWLWTQQDGESDEWYARFRIYLTLGAIRSVQGAYRALEEAEGRRAGKANGSWYRAAARWFWKERAAAWDLRPTVQSDHAEEKEATNQTVEEAEITSIAAPIDRVRMIAILLGKVFQSLETAELELMNTQEAREKLPAIRMLFKDLVAAHRMETAAKTDADHDEEQTLKFTADEFIAAQRELEKWQKRRGANGSADDAAESDEGRRILSDDQSDNTDK